MTQRPALATGATGSLPLGGPPGPGWGVPPPPPFPCPHRDRGCRSATTTPDGARAHILKCPYASQAWAPGWLEANGFYDCALCRNRAGGRKATVD